MTPTLEALQELFKFTGALSILAGVAWWRKGTAEEDAVVSAAADTVLGTLSDADTVNKIDNLAGRNLRDQLTVEEAMELDRERELRRFGRRN